MKGHISLGSGAIFIPEPFITRSFDTPVIKMNLRGWFTLIDGRPVRDARKLRSEIGIGRDPLKWKKTCQAKLRRLQLILVFRIVIGQFDGVPWATRKDRTIRLNQENLFVIEP